MKNDSSSQATPTQRGVGGGPSGLGQLLLTIEKVAVCYAVLTCLLMAVLWPRLVEPWKMVQMRLWWLLMTAALVTVGTWARHRWSSNMRLCLGTDFARVAGQLAWLLYWYPDIYEFNRIRSNLDHLFAATDQWLFGCQPSITFSQWLSGGVWSELFNLGYWSYFPMIATLVAALFIKELSQKAPLRLPPWGGGEPTPKAPQPSALNPQPSALNSHPSALNPLPSPLLTVSSLILASFFIYYLLFLLLPVAGPQFYFLAVGLDEIQAGHFPELGTYFSSHTQMLPAPGNTEGIFYQLVAQSQDSGERPIAAFPSSHIGLSTIVLLLSRRYVPQLTNWLLPFWFLLCCATVYIQAHYLVDALAGLLLAPLVLALSTKLCNS